ncbi:MAG TPA: hypothetical protein VKE74_19975 [Gemmataceae bacterium]|nr:hypothetical protein [Gemmataceae bacterium]
MKLRYNIELPVPDWFDPTRDADALAAMMRAAAERYIEAGPSPTGEWEPLGPVGLEEGGIEVWTNDLYTVRMSRHAAPLQYHLAICRNDRQPIHDWRDLQRIKNDLCGPEAEACEIYPAESRLCDRANTYHLWVLPPGVRFAFGMAERDVTADNPGSVQRGWASGAPG